MDHSQALATHASERYQLGEMSEPERFDFEAHYFDCNECADDVRAGAAFARGVREVCTQDGVPARMPVMIREQTMMREQTRTRRFAWLTPAALLPMAASLLLASFVGYQSLVIGGLRSSRAFVPTVLRAAARGDEQTIELQRGQPHLPVLIDVNNVEPGTPLVFEVSPPNSSARAKGPATAPPAGASLLIEIPASDLNQAGPWTLVIRTLQGAEISRYPFSLKLN